MAAGPFLKQEGAMISGYGKCEMGYDDSLRDQFGELSGKNQLATIQIRGRCRK